MPWGVMAELMGWGIVEEKWRKGPWTAEEDRLLIEYVKLNGEGRWNSVAKVAGLKRNGKSCRLRWVNYLRPDLKRGQITPYEESIILELHARWGNRWSTIARSLPGRTDNEIKNYWRTHFKKNGKNSADIANRSKARLLRRQQFQQQQQLQNQVDKKKFLSLIEEYENKVAVGIPQVIRQDMVTAASPVPASEEHGFFYSMLNNSFSYPTVTDALNEDVMLDGLWNLDDVHGSLNMAAAVANNATNNLHLLASPFY